MFFIVKTLYLISTKYLQAVKIRNKLKYVFNLPYFYNQIKDIFSIKKAWRKNILYELLLKSFKVR